MSYDDFNPAKGQCGKSLAPPRGRLGLSYPAMEEALADRISFRRFAGLSLQDNVPDHSTICRFRAQAQSRMSHLLDLLNSY